MIRRKRSHGHSRGHGLFRPIVNLANKASEYKDEVASVAKNVVSVGKNTREIIKEIKNRSEVENIVNRINKLRQQPVVGLGFAYILSLIHI